ncbi:hypothetical protein ACTGJ9_016855 [Bradyrhizobium sp. RDM12]
MSEIDHAHDAEDDRETERDEPVNQSDEHPAGDDIEPERQHQRPTADGCAMESLRLSCMLIGSILAVAET